MSLARTLRHIRTGGIKKAWRDLQYIGDVKAGTLVGTDTMGNKYYEDLDEIPGRHRWVDYANHDFSTNQLEPLWHSWLHHIRQEPPTNDPIVAASRKTWEAHWNLDHCVRGEGAAWERKARRLTSKWLIASAIVIQQQTLWTSYLPVLSLCLDEGWEHQDSTSGTRGSYRAYSTTISPKIQTWDPSVKPRK